jgi:hypothetical protein
MFPPECNNGMQAGEYSVPVQSIVEIDADALLDQ